MDQQLDQIIKAAIDFLAAKQRPDGGFDSLVSVDQTDFSKATVQPTPFVSGLVGSAIADVPGTNSVRKRAARYLLAQASPSSTWNYWEVGSTKRQSQPYPDDLDDTCVALSAILAAKPSHLNGEVLGQLAKNLVCCESKPGGPYRTWVVDREHAQAVWLDVDAGVNANVGWLLHRLGINLPGLTAHFSKLIKQGAFDSRYYCGELPVLYFLARWYQGPHRDLLRAELRNRLNTVGNEPLQLALCIAGLYHLDPAADGLEVSIGQLLHHRQADHWPARALYEDPPIGAIRTYAGSDALTTAYVLEALSLHMRSKSITKPLEPKKVALAQTTELAISAIADSLPGAELRTQYRAFATGLLGQPGAMQISDMAGLTMTACGITLPAQLRTKLNVASTHGWMAYTLYDMVLDDEAEPLKLGVANVSLRRCTEAFRTALPKHPSFYRHVLRTLDTIDAANTWEVTHARGKLSSSGTWLRYRLPDYGDLSQLAERSLGHGLAAQGVLLGGGHPINSQAVRALQNFYNHYLIARQLNDDAHDWEDDLKRGHLTAVVCMLLAAREPGSKPQMIQVEEELGGLRTLFWSSVCDEVFQQISRHCLLARTALEHCPFTDSSIYEGWLNELEGAAELARRSRDDAQAFIASFQHA